jgi:hypothetical protein
LAVHRFVTNKIRLIFFCLTTHEAASGHLLSNKVK